MKHCAVLCNDPDGLRGLHGLAKERLRELGVTVTKHKEKKIKAFPATPGKKSGPPPLPGSASVSKTKPKNVFGRPLRDLKPSTAIIHDNDVTVPHFLIAILDHLRKHLNTDGLFRKAGSAGRMRVLRGEIEEAETFFVSKEVAETMSALDVASLLKQWLRELPEPLIPVRFMDTFLKCTKLNGEDRVEAILTVCLMLPPLHAGTLSHLMKFLFEVAEAAGQNQMTTHNLAIVFTPCLFPVNDDNNSNKEDALKADLANKLDIVECLIKNADSVCIMDQKMDEALNIPSYYTSEDNLDFSDYDLDGNEIGPSERRRNKHSKNKKRRSGSLSRVFTATMKGIHKAISRSTTPAGARTMTVTDGIGGTANLAFTPYTPATAPKFQSPRLPAKRKVSAEHDLSPNSKHRRAAMDSSFTPKVKNPATTRSRSVSIKSRFKRKKSLTSGVPNDLIPGAASVSKFKEPSLVIHSHLDGNAPVTPGLPSKPSINLIMATPKTPDSLDTGLSANGQEVDLSNDNLEGDQASFDEVNTSRRGRRKKKSSPLMTRSEVNSARSSRSSLASVDSIASTKSYPGGGRVVKRRASDLPKKNGGKPRSPSERKIGIVRRRSQEMARKESLRREQEVRRDKNRIVSGNMPILDESYVRHHLRRGKPNTFRVKPSPMKVEQIDRSGTKKTRIKISFNEGQLQRPRMVMNRSISLDNDNDNNAAETSANSRSVTVNESLTNLRQDISSLIEKSFGTSGANASAIIRSQEAAQKLFEDEDDHEVSFGTGMNRLSLSDDIFGIDNATKKNSDEAMDTTDAKPKVVSIPTTFAEPPAPITTRGMVRRQSSAFEIARLPSSIAKPSSVELPEVAKDIVRRQSSAFELQALNKNKSEYQQNKSDNNEANFNRVATRGSLRHRNSSVKDLVKKLEFTSTDNVSNAETENNKNTNTNKRMSISTSALPSIPASLPDPTIKSIRQQQHPQESETPQIRGRPRTRQNLITKNNGNSSPIAEKEAVAASASASFEEAKDQFPTGNVEGTGNNDQWVDASDFFNLPGPPAAASAGAGRRPGGVPPAFLAFEEASGCKRSSIIRIRTEKRGLVSRSVETFTKPALPPPPITPMRSRGRQAARTPASAMAAPTTAPSRRTSARMGVAGKSLTPAANRRQTLTGIRTTTTTSPASSKKRASSTAATTPFKSSLSTNQNQNHRNHDEPIYSNVPIKTARPYANRERAVAIVEAAVSTPQQNRKLNNATPRSSGGSSRARNNRQRKSKRIEERRHLTIGYSGEVRSPLRERQNTMPPRVATVQRSKSAQNASSSTGKKAGKRMARPAEADIENMNAANVQRSKSLRSPGPPVIVPASLRETIYDVTTPKSEKVKRYLSDRVVTPRGGRQDAAPYIKNVLSNARAANRMTGKPMTPQLLRMSPAVRKSPRLAHI